MHEFCYRQGLESECAAEKILLHFQQVSPYFDFFNRQNNRQGGGPVGSKFVLYLGGPGFKYWPGFGCLDRFCVSFSRQMPEQCVRFGHEHHVSHPYQLITGHRVILRNGK